MSMFLTEEEICDMTGFKRCNLQVKFLQNKGYTVELNKKGHPKVLRSHVESMLGGAFNASRTKEPKKPNLEFLQKMRTRNESENQIK